jgi:hypothetical protein
MIATGDAGRAIRSVVRRVEAIVRQHSSIKLNKIAHRPVRARQ